jgi:hypothetical protein
MAFAMPGNDVIGMDNMQLFIVGLVLTGGAAILAFAVRKVTASG